MKQAEFYNYAKTSHNQYFKNKEEEYNLEVLKLFQDLKVKPTTICTKVSNNHLVLENMAVTESESQVLSKYLKMTKNDKDKIIKNYG